MSESSVVVVDASIAVHTVLATDLSEWADAAWVMWQRQDTTTCAPQLWLYELTSAVHKVFMRGQIDEQAAMAALDTALGLGVRLVSDDDLHRQAFSWATRLGRLAAYDCFYLALAEQLGTELWAADRALTNAARQAGAPWVHWIGELRSSRPR